MSDQIFTCHKSAETHPIACAGFLERGADHNKTVRLAYMFDKLKAMDRSGDYALYEDIGPWRSPTASPKITRRSFRAGQAANRNFRGKTSGHRHHRTTRPANASPRPPRPQYPCPK